MLLSSKLVGMIENHAEDLTRGVIEDLKTNSKTPCMHQLSDQELHDQSYQVYRNLSQWLLELSDEAIMDFHYKLARHRFEEGIPLNEIVFAHILKKYHLRDYIRISGTVDSAADLLQEQELHHLIGSFFDKAIYYTVKGYEEANMDRSLSTVTRGTTLNPSFAK